MVDDIADSSRQRSMKNNLHSVCDVFALRHFAHLLLYSSLHLSNFQQDGPIRSVIDKEETDFMNWITNSVHDASDHFAPTISPHNPADNIPYVRSTPSQKMLPKVIFHADTITNTGSANDFISVDAVTSGTIVKDERADESIQQV